MEFCSHSSYAKNRFLANKRGVSNVISIISLLHLLVILSVVKAPSSPSAKSSMIDFLIKYFISAPVKFPEREKDSINSLA